MRNVRDRQGRTRHLWAATNEPYSFCAFPQGIAGSAQSERIEFSPKQKRGTPALAFRIRPGIAIPGPAVNGRAARGGVVSGAAACRPVVSDPVVSNPVVSSPVVSSPVVSSTVLIGRAP